MKNSIIENYISWLNRFKEGQESYMLVRSATELIDQLSEAHATRQTLEILSQYTAPQKEDHFTSLASNSFYIKIGEWKSYLIELETLSEKTKASLSSMETIAKSIAPLITLIKDVLDEPRSLLHCRSASLLKGLNSSELQPILSYIASLEMAPPALKNSGSFAALPPLDDNHKSCLILLNNISAAYDESNPHSRAANNLLQVLLLIHLDLNTPMPIPTPPAEVSASASSGGCVIS